MSAAPDVVARTAMAAVESDDRESWLSSFGQDARVEDPVGHLPPVVGVSALGDFWDLAIAPMRSVEFAVSRTWVAGSETILLATVTIVAENGAQATYDGAFHYTVGEDEKITTLRGFWDLPEVAAALQAQANFDQDGAPERQSPSQAPR